MRSLLKWCYVFELLLVLIGLSNVLKFVLFELVFCLLLIILVLVNYVRVDDVGCLILKVLMVLLWVMIKCGVKFCVWVRLVILMFKVIVWFIDIVVSDKSVVLVSLVNFILLFLFMV